MAHVTVVQGWREGPITFNPTYKYHLGCNIYSGEPLPPGIAAVRAVDSSSSLADSAEAEGRQPDDVPHRVDDKLLLDTTHTRPLFRPARSPLLFLLL